MFLQKDIDCPIEHKAYCRLYHICFGSYEAYDEWIELMQGKSKLAGEIKKTEEREQEKKEKGEEAKEKKEQDKKNGKSDEVNDEKPKSEAAQKATAQMKEWLDDKLQSVKEAIRVRRDVAVARGAIEANRIAEGEHLYTGMGLNLG
jgi:hypothetical protein